MSSFLPSWSGFSTSSANVTARQRYLPTGEGSPAEEVPGVQPQRQGEKRQVDREEIGGKPARQVDVGHRTALGSQGLRQPCQRTTTAVAHEDEALSRDDTGCNGRSSVLPAFQPCVEEVPHAGLDGKVDERMYSLYADQRQPSPGCRMPSASSTSRVCHRFGHGSLQGYLLARR